MLAAFIKPAHAEDERFTNKHFLELPPLQQKGMIDGIVITLFQVATQLKNNKAQCVLDWYYNDERAKRNGLIINFIKQYPDYSPATVIIALSERECGRYIRGAKTPQDSKAD